MPFRVTEFEPTPNPNAVKCWLDSPISDHPRSFLNRAMAEDDPLAKALFDQAGVTNILMNGAWLTVSKAPDANWSTVKRRVAAVLEAAERT